MCQCIGFRHTMARSKRAAADSGAQRGRPTLQAKSDMPQALSNGTARCETSRRSTRSSTLDQRRQIAVRVKSEPAEVISVSMNKEEHSEQKVMAALAQAVEGEKTEQGRADARKRKRARQMQSSPAHIKQEHDQGGAEPGRREETDRRKGSTGTSKGRKPPSKAALEAEQLGDIGVSMEPMKKGKAAKSLQEQQATVAEDESKAKPKQKKQRRAKPDQAGKAEMPDMQDTQQGVRKAAAAAPRRRKAAERVDAGMHSPVRSIAV